MTTVEIGNKIVELKTLHKQSQILLAQAIEETKTVFSSISEEQRQLLQNKGFDVSVLYTDVDLIKTQDDVNSFKEKLATLVEQLRNYLENSLVGF